ncbi:hypothetical protein [Pseudoalteromonas rubra]|uniref:Outer membrane protein beta-barrel domain-containing protein n=1 Tax=Pseudoalteromonas rubra TaxID=43658 RepID=A0A5S3X099_9GAMM|nr:hypothetical protein [Pseudoalteromonas rubra]TMP37385.1 hypothetical protein CWB98_11700 [Pseudoalteromonas rubra]
MKQLSLVAGLATLLAGAPAAAHTINFDKVEVGYKRFSDSDDDEGGYDAFTGVNVAASKRFDNYYVEGRYYSVSDSYSFGNIDSQYASAYTFRETLELEINQFTLGAGYIHELDEHSLLDVSFHVGRLSLKGKAEVVEKTPSGYFRQNSSGSIGENIYRLRGQYQTRVMNDIELRAGLGLERVSDEDSDTEALFFVGAGYHFNSMFSVHTEYRHIDDYNTLDVNFRYSF